MGINGSQPPFTILTINHVERRVVLSLRADMIGTIARHMQACPECRKAAQSTRRLGFALAAAGNRLFGQQSDHPDLVETQIIG